MAKYIYKISFIYFIFLLFMLSACSDEPITSSDDSNLIKGGELAKTIIMHNTPKVGVVKFKAFLPKAPDSTKYNWTIENKTYFSKELTHIFHQAGDYEVKLVVNDADEYLGTISIPDNVSNDLQIDMGESHTLISFSSKLFVYAGKRANSSICSEEVALYPTQLLNYNHISSIAAGRAHSLFVNGDFGYGCGDNNLGQLALKNSSILESKSPMHIDFDFSSKSSSLSLFAGGDLSLLLKKSEKEVSLYMFGFNGEESGLYSPYLITKGTPRANPQISVGNNFALIRATSDYKMSSFGKNESWQLGRVAGVIDYNVENDDPDLEANKNKNLTDMKLSHIYTPYGDEGTWITYFKNNANAKLATGDGFSVVLRDDGDDLLNSVHSVYVFGNNNKKQLGINSAEDVVRRPTALFSSKLSSPAKSDPNQVKPVRAAIVDVAAGKDFALALDNNSKLYAWGSDTNEWIADGTKDSQNENVFLLNGDYNRVWAGGGRVIALNNIFNLYTWGDNSNGILGVESDEETVNTPKELFFFISTDNISYASNPN